MIAADAAADAGLDVVKFSADTERKQSSLFPRLGSNPVDIGPVMSDSRSQSSSNPFYAMEQTIPMVLGDIGVDCATFTFCAGKQLMPMFPMVVNMIDEATRGISKTVNVWIYGTSYPAMYELARQLQARGLPAYLDLDMAIKSLGAAAHYSRFKSEVA